MLEWYQNPLTALAFLWRLERRDGVAIGFTSHDRDIVRDGLTYRATPGMLPSAIERGDPLKADGLDINGALTSDALREDDLLAGRWDGAAFWLNAVDWQSPSAPAVLLVRGELGAVEISDGRFSVALRGPGAAFEAAVAPETSPDCRARLGDRRCRVAMAGRRRLARVTARTGKVLTLDMVAADGIYAFGLLRWMDGANSGLDSRIMQSAGAAVTLEELPPASVMIGGLVELIEGCDKRFATCVSRFGNALNFRGEPHLPGNDLLTRYAS